MKTKLSSLVVWLGLVFTTLSAEPSPWEFTYTVADPGTRSEHVVGALNYRGEAFATSWQQVITPVGEFRAGLAPGTGLVNWIVLVMRPDGSFAAGVDEAQVKKVLSGSISGARKAVPPGAVTKSSEASLPGSFEKRPEGVGPDWFYAVKFGIWVNPEKMDEAFKKSKSSKN